LTYGDWFALGVAAAGAFFGAGFAFLLEWLRRTREANRSQYSLLIQAQFSVGMQLNTAVSIRDQWLDPVRDEADRYFRLPLLHIAAPNVQVDLTSLAFVAVDDLVQPLQQIHVAQESYLTAMHALQVRNDMLNDIYRSGAPLHDFDFESGTGVAQLDVRQVRILKGTTDGLYMAIDTAIEQEVDAIQQLTGVIARLFPKRQPLGIEFTPEAADTSS